MTKPTHQARKRFGQNFLVDPGIIGKITRAISPKPSQHIVEIGPGLGALTTAILPLAERMDVVELDRDIIPQLKIACLDLGELNIHQHDALRFDFAKLAKDDTPMRIIGNLPYNISSPLIFHLLDYAELIKDMHFMLQKEVVTRMAAKPGNKSYGRLSVMVQYHCEVSALFNVPATAFRPAPKVVSAFLRLVPKPPSIKATDYKKFSELVRLAFNQRRKILSNSLKNIIVEDAFAHANIDPKSRPEQLSVEDFVRLSNANLCHR